MTAIKIEVACTGQGYGVRVDDDPVTFVNDTSNPLLDLPQGEHSLTWYMWGNPGSTISVTAKAGQTTIMEIKDRKIPKHREMAHGAKYLKVPA